MSPHPCGLPTITAVLSYQAFIAWESYGLTDVEKMVFVALVLGPIAITQGLGKYHRNIGYSADQCAKDFGHKAK